MSGPGETPYFGEYPPDFFDFIVVDECHRGGANDEGNWRAILDYFAPAVQLGLTATPKRTANANTYAYFGNPVYMYSLKEGINDGFLTPFKVKQIATTIDDYTYTPDDAVVAGEVVAGKRYVESDFNRIIVIPEREAYFTIYDFVRAHHHFNDPEWDGEPAELEPAKEGTTNTNEVREPQADYLPQRPEQTVKVEVKLADGKARQIQSMTATTFWSADGTPMSAAQFLENLYGVLPEFFKDEDELRAIWSAPETRKALLAGLADKGFSKEPLLEMQKAIEAENSDLFDVLAYVAFAAAPETRVTRADHARGVAHQHFNDRQQAFLDFVLAQYVTQGVEELDTDKLTPLLRLKYHNAISDAVADLGGTGQIRTMFTGFQKYLYQDKHSGPRA